MARQLAGPFTALNLPKLQVSPKKTPGEFHLIHYLSYLKGMSVNAAIPTEFCTVHGASFDHALVRVCGASYQM